MDADRARALYRQVLKLRELLEAVAGDVEGRGQLLRRAMRIRARLHAL